MRFTDCNFKYLDEVEDIFEEVPHGALTSLGKSPNARVALYVYDANRRRFNTYDQLVNVAVTENPDGSVRLKGDSMRAESAFGAGSSGVEMLVTPAENCVGCSR